MSKVLLVRIGNPSRNSSYFDRFGSKFDWFMDFFYRRPYRPYNLFVLANSLRKKGHDCDILDLASFMKIERKTIMKKFVMFYDIIGFSFFTPSYLETLEMAEICKKINPKLKIVFGGPHATFEWFEILQNHKFVDYIVTGEGEKSIVDLANGKRYLR